MSLLTNLMGISSKSTFGITSPRSIASLLCVLLAAASCKSGITDNRSTQLSSQSITQTVKNGAEGEIITHRDQATNSRIAQVQIPMGALAVGQKVTVTPSYHTDPSDLKDEFGIAGNTNIKETQIATVVSSNMDQNLQQPMVIALDLPPKSSGLFGLVWDDRNFFVVYTVRDSAQDIWKRGIMPDEALTIKDDRVLFSSQLLGRYEIFESSEPVTAKAQEHVAPKPDFSNPPVAITRVTPVIAPNGGYVTVKGKYFTENTTLKVDGQEVKDLKFYPDGKMIGFPFPAMAFGQKTIEVTEGSNTSTAKIIAKGSTEQAIIDAPSAEVCQGVSYINLSGDSLQGSKVCALASCNRDNQTGCTANASFPAVASAAIDYTKIFKQVIVQGQEGNYSPPSLSQACQISGETECQTTGNFIAIKQGILTPNNVRKGVTIPKAGPGSADVVGNYPNSQAKLPHASNAATLTKAGFAAAVTSSNQTFEYWDRYGNKYNFVSQGNLTPENIRHGASIFGVDGKPPQGSKPLCQGSGQVLCQAEGSFVAAQLSRLTAGNIKKNVTIGTVKGDFPSDTYPLTSVDGDKILKPSNFDEAVTSSEPYVYFDSVGQKHTFHGSESLDGGNIKNGITLYGEQGKLYDFDANLLQPKNIRIGRTIGGVVGTLKDNCRNQAKLSFYNYTGNGAANGTGYLNTILEKYHPTDNPWPGEDRYRCDETNWEDITNINGLQGCSSLSYKCVFRDKTSRLLWAGISANSTETLSSLNTRCSQADYGGFTDWKIPSHDELMQAYIHGIAFLDNKIPNANVFSTLTHWWSRSPTDNTSTQFHALSLNTGYSYHASINSVLKGACIREGDPND